MIYLKNYLFICMFNNLTNYIEAHQEIKSIIPPKASFARNTRFLKTQHPYRPTHLNCNLAEQTHSPNRLSLWHLESGTLFLRPSSQQLITFNLSRPASMNTFDSDPISKNLVLFSRYKDPPQTTGVVSFWCNFFLYQYHNIHIYVK